jgi:peptidoglycan/LPS O-acetylase OafA/YrhL
MDFLLIIRGLLAISVVIWHSVGFSGALHPVINLPGRTAVWLFFGISGYVIAYGFIHRRYALSYLDLKDFYINRLLRIYPLFIAISFVSWLTELTFSRRSPLVLSDLSEQLMLLQFNHDYNLNGVFWTLGIEVHFYLLAPIIILLFAIKTFKNKLIIPSFLYLLSITWIYFAVRKMGWSFDGRNIISNLPHFISGMLACVLVHEMKPTKSWLLKSIALSALLLGYTNWLYHHHSGKYWSMTGIFLVDLLIISLVVAHANFEFTRLKKNRLIIGLYLLGTLSYGVYAWHAYLIKYFPVLSRNLFLLIVVSFYTAYISYRLIEQPILKFKREKNQALIRKFVKS